MRRAGPTCDLPRADFDDIVTYLAGGGRVLGSYGTYGKIVVENGRFRVASRAVARDYYMNIGTISDDFQVKIVTRAQRRLGEVEESFLAALQPGDAFVIGGRAVVLDRMQGNTAVVKPASGERVHTPRWMGPKMPLTARLAEEELTLRRDLREAWEAGGPAACRRVLASSGRRAEPAIERVIEFLERQHRAAPIPVTDPVQVERVREGRSQLILFHVVAGRAVNRSLAWVLGHRLGVGGSVVANHDDHSFLISVACATRRPVEQLRAAFHPGRLARRSVPRSADHRDARPPLPARSPKSASCCRSAPFADRGRANSRAGTPSLLYTTLLRVRARSSAGARDRSRGHGGHDGRRARACRGARASTRRIGRSSICRGRRPSRIPLFAAFSRETLVQQDPERALDELVAQAV